MPAQLGAAVIEGTVFDADSRRPLSFASVYVIPGRLGAVADSSGQYRLDLSPGQYEIRAEMLGYETAQQRVALGDSQRLRIDLPLQARTLVMPEMCVTATGLPKQLAAATVPVEIVNRKAIDLSNADNVGMLLEDVAGLNVHRSLYGYLGSPTGVMIQGIDPNRVLILIDGEQVIGGPGGVIDLSRLPVSQVERIEVVKGPHSALYGSDAMGGVVHILTRPPQQTRSGDLRLGFGSGGLASAEGNASVSWSRLTASAVASMSRRDALDRSPQDPDTQIDSHTQRFLQGKASWRLRRDLTLRGFGRWLVQEEQGIASQHFAPLNKTYVWNFPDRMLRVDLGGAVDWARVDGGTAAVEVSRSYFDNHGVEELVGSLEQRDRGTRNVLTEYRARTVHLIGRKHQVTAGLEHGREALEVLLERTLPLGDQTRTVEVPQSDVNAVEAYVQNDWQLNENTGIVWGVRLQRHSRYGSNVAPKVSFAHRLSRSVRVCASYGQGYRAPSLKELHFTFDHSNLGYKVLGSPSLRPERTWGLNAGAQIRPSEALDLRANFFHNHLRHLIQTVFDPEQSTGALAIYSYGNVGQAVTRGVEVGMTTGAAAVLSLNTRYTYLLARARGADRDLPGRPRHALRVRATWVMPSSGRLELKLRSDSAVWADSEGTLRSPGGSEWDVNAEQPLARHVTLQLGVENIFDNRRDLSQPGDLRSVRGRSVRGGLTIQP